MIRVSNSTVIVGDVRIADRASIWHGAVLRGDFDYVEVGADSNVQDNTVLHVDRGMPCRIGSRVTVGHGAIVHGSVVEDDCLVGINATINSGALIRRGSLVASGALVPELATYPERSLILGVPAKAVRPVDDVLSARIELSWKIYRDLADRTLPARPALPPDPSKQVHLDLSSQFTRLIERR